MGLGAAEGFGDPTRAVGPEVGGHQARAPGGGQAAQQPCLAAGAGAQIEPEFVRAGETDASQGQRSQLAGLVLDGGLAAGDQGRRVAGGQPEAVR